MLNTIAIQGVIVKDPYPPRLSKSNQLYSRIRICNHQEIILSDRATKDERCYLDVYAFGDDAIFAFQYFRRGDVIMAQGALRSFKKFQSPDDKVGIDLYSVRAEWIGHTDGHRHPPRPLPEGTPTRPRQASDSPRHNPQRTIKPEEIPE